jgi:hypothetical protein
MRICGRPKDGVTFGHRATIPGSAPCRRGGIAPCTAMRSTGASRALVNCRQVGAPAVHLRVDDDPDRDHSGRVRRHRQDAAAWVSYEPAVDEGGLRYIWLEPRWLDRLNSYRGSGESYSDVILRLAAEGGRG